MDFFTRFAQEKTPQNKISVLKITIHIGIGKIKWVGIGRMSNYLSTLQK